MPNAAKKSRPDDQGSDEQTQVQQASTEPDSEDDFDMDELEDMAALLIDALTIPVPAENEQIAEDRKDTTREETPHPSSPRQLQ